MKKAGSKMEHQGIKIEFIGQIGKLFHFSSFPLKRRCFVCQYDMTVWCFQRQIVLFPYKTKTFFFQNYIMTEEITMSLPPLSKNLLGQGRSLETQAMGLSFNRLRSRTSHTRVPMWGYGTLFIDLMDWCYGVRLIENKRCQIYEYIYRI